MVGPSGSGKSMAWRVLLKALERLEGVEGVCHVIDPKVSSLSLSLSPPHLQDIFLPNRPFPKRICMVSLILTLGNGRTASSLTSFES